MIFLNKILLLCFLNYSLAINERELRIGLFKNYSKNRPVYNNSDTIVLKYGLEIENLVFFNQKSENIEITMKNILLWKDNYLTWDIKDNPNYITVNNRDIWLPDLELYNAASKPKLYNKKAIVKVSNDGTVELTRLISYSFACKLELSNFPFDTQICKMLFGSWKYPKQKLDIQPFSHLDFYNNFSISPQFTHNEWHIQNIEVKHDDYEYKCCPGDLWPNSVYTIVLKRNPHKYNILIVMAIFITLSSLSVNLINVSIYARSYVLVFIPLTLIWLQIHTSSKIPIIEYSTTLEKIILCCFLTTMVSLFESAIVYCFLTNYYKFFLKYIEMDHDNIIKTGFQYYKFYVIKPYDISINNMNYYLLKKIAMDFDSIYRVTVAVSFVLTISIILY